MEAVDPAAVAVTAAVEAAGLAAVAVTAAEAADPAVEARAAAAAVAEAHEEAGEAPFLTVATKTFNWRIGPRGFVTRGPFAFQTAVFICRSDPHTTLPAPACCM